jgi:hypothetical protein
LKKEFAFPANYEIECDAELPGTGAEVQYFTSRQDPASLKVHALCKISPNNGAAWFAAFEEGYTPSAALSTALSTPDPETACVVSAGSGFVFQPSQPDKRWLLPVFPVRYAYPLPQHELILFADFSGMCALDGNGIAWRSGQIFWDELSVVSIDQRSVLVQGCELEQGAVYEVDISSGRFTAKS